MADPTRMEEYYKILNHLKGFKVDRQYPYSFQTTDNVKPSEKVESIAVEDMSHANLLRFTSLTEDDVIIIPTIQRDYFSIDSVEIKVSPLDGDLDPSKVELEFHDTLKGDVALSSLPGSGETIVEDSVGAVTFVINDQSMDPKSSVLAGVQSLSIHLNQSITGIELSDVVFRSNSCVCTLEDLEKSIPVGENYIIDSVEIETVPESLLKYKYMAGAALLWLGKWEHEGRVMGDGTRDSKNYADRLLSIVNRAINNYGYSSEGDDSEGGINEDLVGSSLI